MAPTFAVGAFMFDWTGITNLSISPIRDDLLTSAAGVQFQDLALWANVMILFGFVMKLVRVIITGSVANIWNGYKRPYAAFSRPAIFGAVPYLASAVTVVGLRFHFEQAQFTISSMGVLSIMEAGVTRALKMIRALPPSTT